ncbi:MAG: endonuclease [Ktedonobacteraceae bacterium]
MAVYLIHFDKPYKHAEHYLGYSSNLKQRLHLHKSGTGARLMTVIAENRISWQLARVWPDGDRALEHQLKLCHSGKKFCPICKQLPLLEELGIDLFTSPFQ